MKPSERFDSLVTYYAERAGLPADLIKRQMMAESSGNPSAKSQCGAQGLLQLMPVTANEMGCVDPYNPDQNLRAGTEYLARQRASVQLLLHGHTVDEQDILRLALASFNCGYGYIRVAIKMALELGQPITWGVISGHLPKAVVRGRVADLKQVNGYIERILPPSQ